MILDEFVPEPKSETILGKLEELYILSVKKSEVNDGHFTFREACDEFFFVELSKDDVLSFINELKSLINDI